MIQPLSEEDIEALLAVCDIGDEFGCRNRAIILLFLDTGMRSAELHQLTLADVSWETRRILWCFKTLSALCESRPPESLRAEGRRCGSIGDCFWSGWECSAGGDGI